MKEITLDLTTIKVPRNDSYSIEDMERMFGKRIKKAINKDVDKSGRMYKAIKTKEMAKISKWWKFWNADIRKAYKNYVGMVIVPWIVIREEPQIVGCYGDEKELKKYIITKFKKADLLDGIIDEDVKKNTNENLD